MPDAVVISVVEKIIGLIKGLNLSGPQVSEIATILKDSSTKPVADYERLAMMGEAELSSWFEPRSRGELDEAFVHFFPGGRPEILEDCDVKSFIRAAVAKLQQQRANESK